MSADTKIEFSEITTVKVIRLMQEAEAPLPWNLSDDGESLIDASGHEVILPAGHDGDWGVRVLSLVLVCVNTCGGFKAESAAKTETPNHD